MSIFARCSQNARPSLFSIPTLCPCFHTFSTCTMKIDGQSPAQQPSLHSEAYSEPRRNLLRHVKPVLLHAMRPTYQPWHLVSITRSSLALCKPGKSNTILRPACTGRWRPGNCCPVAGRTSWGPLDPCARCLILDQCVHSAMPSHPLAYPCVRAGDSSTSRSDWTV